MALTVTSGTSVLLSWDASTIADADFGGYFVYRREPSGEPAAQVWAKIQEISSKVVTTTRDYEAGFNETYEYKVTQFNKTTLLESGDGDIVTVSIEVDDWAVIGADLARAHIATLVITEESHQTPVQQEVFEPLGSSRKTIVRGNVLGAEGTITVRFDPSEARDGQILFEYLTNTTGPHILKSPFGDVWSAEFGTPSKRYLVRGALEMTVGWIQVV